VEVVIDFKGPDGERDYPSTVGEGSLSPLEELFNDLDAIRGHRGVPDDGTSDRSTCARAVAEEPKYRR
jgi:hypothetical protein